MPVSRAQWGHMALLWLTGPTGAGKSTTGAFLRDEHQVSQRRSSMSFYFFCFYPVVFLWRRLFPLSCSKSLRIWSSGCVSKHLERSWSCYSFNRLPTGKKKYELEQAVDEERRRICRDAQNAYKPLVEVGNFFFHWVRLLVLRGCFLTPPPPLFMSKNKECQIAN